MKELTTITEKELLYCAIYTILDKYNREFDHLQKSPDNQFTKARFEKIKAQYDEIHDRILEIERSEQH